MAADTTADTGTDTKDTTGDDTYKKVIDFFIKYPVMIRMRLMHTKQLSSTKKKKTKSR